MSEASLSERRHKVGLVVDRQFGDRLLDLSRSFHTWVVESPTNSPMVQRIWNTERKSAEDDSLDSGATSFQSSERETPEQMCVRLATDLDDHHGEFGHEPPWSEIEVFGAKLTDEVRQTFRDLGVTVFEVTQDGFRCLRTDDGA